MNGKLRLLFWLGVLALFVPYFGVRSPIKTVITTIIGILVIYLSFRLRRAYKIMKLQLKQAEHAHPEQIQ